MDISLDILKEGRVPFFFYLSIDEFKSLLEDGESLVYRLIVDDERWFDADSFGTIECTSHEDSSLEELRCDLITDFFRSEVLTDEESFSCNRLIDFWIFCYERLESLHHVSSLFLCLVREIITQYYLDTCDSS